MTNGYKIDIIIVGKDTSINHILDILIQLTNTLFTISFLKEIPLNLASMLELKNV